MSPEAPPTVLVVEDELAVRTLIGKILEMRNYRVLTASHGEEALAVSETFAGSIHLLLTDIMMPVMNGRELASRLALLRPGLRILFISGYPGHDMPDGPLLEKGMGFLPKPFRPDALLASVESLLKDAPEADEGGRPASPGN